MADGASVGGLGAWTRRSSARCSPASRCSASDWYAERLEAKQAAASARAEAGLAAIEKFVSTPGNEEPTARLGMPARVAAARAEAERLSGPQFAEQLVGTAGSTPL